MMSIPSLFRSAPAQPGNDESSHGLFRPVAASLVGTVLVFCLLQLWRSHFFLTDDNLTGGLPSFTDIGSSIVRGEFNWRYRLLYNGEASIFWDLGGITLLHPFHIAAALLTQTGMKYWVVDFICLANMLLGAGFFAGVIVLSGRRHDWAAGTAWTACLSVSYVSTYYCFGIGSSWLTFLANQAALPMIACGFFAGRRRNGLLLVAAGLLHGFIGGHLSPLIFSILFVMVWVGMTALVGRDPEPAIRLTLGGLLAGALVTPLLIPSAHYFFQSRRAEGFPMQELRAGAIPFLQQLAGGMFQGGWSWAVEGLGLPKNWAATRLPFIFSAIWPAVGLAVAKRARWRREQVIVLLMLLLAMFFVARPIWLQWLLMMLPLFKSLRWPFREAVVVLFFAHLLVAFRWREVGGRWRALALALGAALFLGSLALKPAPTLNLVPVDRYFILSGKADAVWHEVKERLGVTERTVVVPSMPRDAAVWNKEHPQEAILRRQQFLTLVPHSIAAGYNFPACFGIRSATGYSILGFARDFHGLRPMLWCGYFDENETPKLAGSGDYLFVFVTSLNPPVIQMRREHRSVTIDFPGGCEAPVRLREHSE